MINQNQKGQDHCNFDEKFIQRWFLVFRTACSFFISHWESTHKLGGEGRVVQIDESSFTKKAKYHRGRHASEKQWVFGITEVSGIS